MYILLLFTSLITTVSLEAANNLPLLLGEKRKNHPSNLTSENKRREIDESGAEEATEILSQIVAPNQVRERCDTPASSIFSLGAKTPVASPKGADKESKKLPQQKSPISGNPSRSGTPSCTGTSSFLCAELKALEVAKEEEVNEKKMDNNDQSEQNVPVGSLNNDGRTTAFEKMKNSGHRRSQSQ